MQKKKLPPRKKSTTGLKGLIHVPFVVVKSFWGKNWATKILTLLIALVLVLVLLAYSISQWHTYKHRNDRQVVGATFITNYAEHFGLDPKETLHELIYDLGITDFRLVSYWKDGEATEGQYDFSDLDWQIDMIEQVGGTVSLAIGLRQPRWPECHMPTWAMQLPMESWAPKLKDYMGATINRYKDRDVLKSYQLENEFFLSVFGECPDFTRERLIDEYNFVRSLDDSRPLIISRSNNALGIPINEPLPDISAVSVYKRVWDKTLTKRYFEYPLPAWFYGALAGTGELVNGTDLILHELQTEAWLPEGFEMNDVNDIPEQEKSLNAARLKDRIRYGESTGIKTMYLWGVEWWYWQKEAANKPDLWNTAKAEISRLQAKNQ